MKPIIHLLAIGSFSILGIGCSTNIKVHKEEKVRQIQWSNAVAPYAMLSLLAYHGEGNGEVAAMKNGPVSKTLEQLPRSEDGLVKECRVRLANDGWKRIEAHVVNPDAGRSEKGLYFEVWLREKDGQSEIAFVFEGTNFEERADWRSNFRWLRVWRKHGERGDQYDAASALCLKIHKRLIGQYGREVRFSSTGHSLGGGLAQHVYYAGLPDMDRAVVFDTSPVTGFRDLSDDQQLLFRRQVYRDEFPSYRVLRVHEDGEILEYLRNFTQKFFKQDSVIRGVEFKSRRGGNVVAKHSIARLVSKVLEAELAAKKEIRTEVAKREGVTQKRQEPQAEPVEQQQEAVKPEEETKLEQPQQQMKKGV